MTQVEKLVRRLVVALREEYGEASSSEIEAMLIHNSRVERLLYNALSDQWEAGYDEGRDEGYEIGLREK